MNRSLPTAFVAALTASLAACDGPSIDVDLPFAVTFTAPSHGAVDISQATDIRVGFNRPVNPESAALGLLLDADGQRLRPALTLLQDDELAILVPTQPLPPGATIRLTVSGSIASADGVALESTLEAEFTTVDF